MSEFKGFSPETYMFFMELGFNNSKTWLDVNRDRYKKFVQQPMKQLTEMLLPTMLKIDPDFNPRPSSIISRINRDTRYSKNKLPYRDHSWLGFRREGQSLGESLCMFFEIAPTGYSYGLGMYMTNLEIMRGLRAHAVSDPAGFEAVISNPALKRYAIEGDLYKKDMTPNLPDHLKFYLNRKGLSFIFSNTSLVPTMNEGIYDEVKGAMEELAPLYRYIMNIK